MTKKLWFIGEKNPYFAAHHEVRFDLFPHPANSAGGRLCFKILGISRSTYLERFERRNLLRQPKWSAPAAREAAQKLIKEADGAPMVWLGAKVTQAFGYDYAPLTIVAIKEVLALILPHPSGLNRFWNEPEAFLRARKAIEALEAAARGEV